MPASPRPKRYQLPLPFRLAAEATSSTLRARVGSSIHAPLCERQLVGALGLPLLAMTELLDDCPEAVYRLFTHQGKVPAFSATAICKGSTAIGIVYNDAHEPERQRADIAHEAAHILLGHEPSALLDADGRRSYPEREEAEAHWLGPALLVPRAGLLQYLGGNPTLQGAAGHFGVSLQLVRYRYNTTGCQKHVPLNA